MANNTFKENLTQVILIILGILIAFAVDRAYENFKIKQGRKAFIENQKEQLMEEQQSLKTTIEYTEALLHRANMGLDYIDNLDTIITYTAYLPNYYYFSSEFNTLRELREIYPVNDYLDISLRKAYKSLYGSYSNIQFYENQYTVEIEKNFRPFWRKNHNSFNDTFINKDLFKSSKYLNIISSCKDILNKRIEAYEYGIEKNEQLIKKLASS